MTPNNESADLIWEDTKPEEYVSFQSPEELPSALDNPTRHFTERYWAALIITAGLFVVSYYLLNFILDNQAQFVSQINLIGRQNVLSQEIIKQILLLRSCQEEKYCQRQLKILNLRINRFEEAQDALLNGHQRLVDQGFQNDHLDDLIRRNKNDFRPIIRAAQTITRVKEQELHNHQSYLPNPNLLTISINSILQKEPDLIKSFTQLATLYNQESQRHISRIKLYQGFVLSIALIVLLLEALFLFPPIVKKIKTYLIDLEDAHYHTKVNHQKISEAYQQLKVVERVTRLNAEALKKTNRDLLRTQDELTRAHQELKEKNKRLEEASNVMHINQQLEAARFFDAAMNHFSELMRWKTNQTIYSWAENLLAELVPYVSGLQAILYVYDSDKEGLFMAASYATAHELLLEKAVVNMGDGLVGQVAKSLHPIYLESLNGQASMFQTHSGTTDVVPNAIIVLPLTYNNSIAGVLEMTAAKTLSPKYIDLLKRMSDGIGAHLSTLLDQKRINQLFADSQLAQKKLRKSLLKIQDNEERFRKLSEVTQEGILFLDGNLIKDTNSVLIKMMGYISIKELWNKHYIDMIAPKYRFEIIEKRMLEDGRSHETVGIRKDGETFPIEIQSRKVRYNEEVVTVISIRDITEKKTYPATTRGSQPH
ncbi:MAG: PAS domain S-box protein, partial [Bacteroidia bacterium]|nr:PAS domain S-box protein [Bacteroidia bacterium]